MDKYLIGLDLGTSAIKGILITSQGEVVAKSAIETKIIRYDDKRVEFDAQDHYIKTAAVIKELSRSISGNGSITALCIASASGNTLLADSQGKPLMNAISWLDQRVTDETDIVMGYPDPEDIYETVGWGYSNSFPLAHLSWLRLHTPELLDSSEIVCMTTDYINYRLTGRWGIDHSTATTFYLQDQKSKMWNTDFLNRLGIPEYKLPALYKSGHLLGEISFTASEETGLMPGTKVILGSFDHPCAARGSKTLYQKQLLISCGTSWVAFFPLSDRDDSISRNMITDVFTSDDGGCWAGMLSMPAIADNIDDYLRNHISPGDDRYKEFDRLAAMSPAGANGLIIDPVDKRISTDITVYPKKDITRALMEGTVFRLKSMLDKHISSGLEISSVTMVGGPTKADIWPQITADILGIDISIINSLHAGAFGAAILAGIGSGVYEDIHDAYNKIKFDEKQMLYSKNNHRLYEDIYLNFKTKYNLKEGPK